jgi:hypothetical protein
MHSSVDAILLEAVGHHAGEQASPDFADQAHTAFYSGDVSS